MVYPPKGAITLLEDLNTIIVLGLSVEIWDMDMNKIVKDYPTGIEKTGRGLILISKERDFTKYYLRWFGFDDPSYDALSVVQSVDDELLNKINVHPASLYMFNTKEEAVAARQAHIEEQKRRNAQRRATNH